MSIDNKFEEIRIAPVQIREAVQRYNFYDKQVKDLKVKDANLAEIKKVSVEFHKYLDKFSKRELFIILEQTEMQELIRRNIPKFKYN